MGASSLRDWHLFDLATVSQFLSCSEQANPVVEVGSKADSVIVLGVVVMLGKSAQSWRLALFTGAADDYC